MSAPPEDSNARWRGYHWAIFLVGTFFGFLISRGRAPLHQSRDTHKPQCNTENEQREAKQELTGARAAKTCAPPAPHDEGKSGDDTNYWKEGRKWGAFIANILTMFAVIWYACIANHQLTDFRKQLKITQDVESARLVVTSYTAEFADRPPSEKIIRLTMVMENAGKTAALEMNVDQTCSFNDRPLKPTDKFSFTPQPLPYGDSMPSSAPPKTYMFECSGDNVQRTIDGTIYFANLAYINYRTIFGEPRGYVACLMYYSHVKRPHFGACPNAEPPQ
jgi:hypothetical protein